MFGGGRSMGGGGNLLKSVGRTVARVNVAGGALQEPLSSSSSSSSSNGGTAAAAASTSRRTRKSNFSNNLSLSSNPSTSPPSPPSAHYGLPSSSTYGCPTTWSSLPHYDDYDWVSVNGVEDFGEHGGVVVDDFVIGSVPSHDEVKNVVSALQQVVNPASNPQLVRDKFASKPSNTVDDQASSPTGLGHRISSVGSELDWVEPPIHLCSSKMVQSGGYGSIYEAFHLLQTEPSIQRMVVSISSDQSVWDAVMNNEAVREILYADQESGSENPDETPEDSEKTIDIIKWIFDNTRAKFFEVIEKITGILGHLFQPLEHVNSTAGTNVLFNEKLKTSFMLSVIVMLIVVVSRAQKA